MDEAFAAVEAAADAAANEVLTEDLIDEIEGMDLDLAALTRS